MTTVQYTGTYTTQWGKLWSAAYTGYYTKAYAGQYTKTYVGQWTGTYNADYSKQFAKVWSHTYVKAYEKSYIGQYTKTFYKTYKGIYEKIWTNANGYDTQYEGGYTGYFARDGIGLYEKAYVGQYAGDRTYDGQYAGYFTGYFTGAYEGAFDKQFEGYYTAQWEKIFEKIWSTVFVGYSESYITRSEQFAGERTYNGDYSGTRDFSGSRSYQDTTTAQYNLGNFASTWHGVWTGPPVTSYFMGPTVYYQPWWSYQPVWYDFEPKPWSSSISYFFGQWTGYFVQNWEGPAGPTSQAFYAGPGGPNYTGTYLGAAQSDATQYEGVEVWYEDFGPLYFPVNYTGPGPTPYYGTYTAPVNFQKQWTTAAVYNGTYTSLPQLFGGSRTYAGQYEGQFGGTRYFIGPPSYVGYDAYYEDQYTGTTYIGLYTGTFTGDRDHTFEDTFEKQFAGNRTYSGQYERTTTVQYAQNWDHIFYGQYTGLQTYGGKTTGANFVAQYEGSFDRGYDKQFEGEFLAYYDGEYEGYYGAQYTGYFAGSREHTYEGYYDRTYEGYFDRAYAGTYGNSYGAQYTGYYQGQYSKNYIGYYITNYGGSYAGDNHNHSPSYSGTTNYTKAYSGPIPYDAVWASVTSAANTKTGELTSEGIAKIKDSGTWKQAKEIFIKKNGSWAESKAVYTKKNGSWELVHIGWERSDITISTSQKNWNLFNHLTQVLSASPSTRPQLVNIYIDGVDVYSTSSTPAMDLATGMGTINIGGTSIKHLVRVFLHPDARIIGAAGVPGSVNASTRTGNSGTNGQTALKTGGAIELYIENYGTIAGGGGGGGSGGYPVHGSTLSVAGGVGGYGAGYAVINSADTNILENDSRINGTNASADLAIHGGSGGLLGQRGSGAGGYNHPDGNIANPGTLNSQYDLSGNGGLPGSAITGYDATRVTFINTGKVWGDSKYKFT